MEQTDPRADEELLVHFNKREQEAFARVYILMFDEMRYFVRRLFKNETLSAEDVVQDVFMVVWEKSKLQFQSLDHLKNYIYLSIKNRYKDYLKHQLHNDKYVQEIKWCDEEAFSYQVESELFSLLNTGEHLLPRECARVLKLYLEGYDISEIAASLGKSSSTVYHQRDQVVKILKKHLAGKNLKMFVFLLSI